MAYFRLHTQADPDWTVDRKRLARDIYPQECNHFLKDLGQIIQHGTVQVNSLDQELILKNRFASPASHGRLFAGSTLFAHTAQDEC